MAIAFRAVGTRYRNEAAVTGGAAAVPMPAGTVAGDLLLAFVLFDSNSNPTVVPSGWTLVGSIIHADTASGSYAPPALGIWRRIATGTEGASQTWNFSLAGFWPAGNPHIVAMIGAYSGCDQTSPVEMAGLTSAPGNSGVGQTHAAGTSATANGWLVSFRGRSAASLPTFTIDNGDTSRAQDSFAPLSCGLFDTAGTLPTVGLQPARTTIASLAGNVDGDVMATLVLKVASSASAVTATAGVAQVAATAYSPTTVGTAGPWDLCTSVFGLPSYTWAIDWGLDGLAAAGEILNTDPYFATGLAAWAPTGAALTLTTDLLSGRNLTTILVSPTGLTTTADIHSSAHLTPGTIVGGQQYVAQCWVWMPVGWTDMRTAVDWYDNTNTFISSGLGVASVVGAGAWTQLSQQFTAPPTAVSGVLRARAGTTPPTTAKFYVYGLLLMDPNQPEEQITPSPMSLVQMDITDGGVTWSYGRDQMRQSSPAALGSAGFSVNNSARRYSPDRTDSPLYGTLDAARPMAGQVMWGGNPYPLFQGRVDNYTINSSRSDRSVAFTFLDSEAGFQNTPVTTPLYSGIRTGDGINHILDAVGWTGPRSIDPGATLMPWWWLNNAAAGNSINDLVLSEGPPAIFYIAPDGTATFRDRTHRLLREPSLTVQGTFTANEVDCSTPPVTGLSWTDESFTYAHGWRDIVNTVNFAVDQRAPDGVPTVVWSSTDVIQIPAGTFVQLFPIASDPFLNAQVPVSNTDFTVTGGVLVFLGQTSGLSTVITLFAPVFDAVVTGMQLRACSVPVVGTVNVNQSDTTSISEHGSQAYPQTAPWAGTADALAISSNILRQYAERRPIVTINISAKDPLHYAQILQRTVSDRIHITYGETGTDADFYVEHVAHTLKRQDWSGRPPVHGVVLGCEQRGSLEQSNPFTFDLRGAGFDAGTFDPPTGDDPATVFVFDDPVQGAFGVGRLGT